MVISESKLKIVWAVVERDGRSVWLRIGYAWEHNGMLYAKLDTLPLSGKICIKDWAGRSIMPELGELVPPGPLAPLAPALEGGL
jgi:hypothetical protein